MNSNENTAQQKTTTGQGAFALMCALALVTIPAKAAAQTNTQVKQSQFITSVFGGDIPAPQTLWIKNDLKRQVKKVLKHAYPSLRIRYWQTGARTLWILDEIGKYKPITVGVVVQNGAIERLKVLHYRESHGWQVRHDFFTRQFIGATLPKPHTLDRHIDGISGATLSVRALKKLAILALILDQSVQTK